MMGILRGRGTAIMAVAGFLSLGACKTVPQAAAGFTPQQVAVLEANGFHQSGPDWQFGAADRLLFPTGKSQLMPEQHDRLIRMASSLAKVGIDGAAVEGHTDITGSTQRNDDLSFQRASAVVAALTDGGMKADKLVARGLGKRFPIESNATAAGRHENRRVVIIVTAQ